VGPGHSLYPCLVGCLPCFETGWFLLVMGGTRTHHRLWCAIEDAGFEIRDTLGWFYGSGFPKSLDVSKAIDKAAGAEREVVGQHPGTGNKRMCGKEVGKGFGPIVRVTLPATDASRRWEGWGSALKPAWEPIVLARKPLSEPGIAANVLRWGTGGINIGRCRIGTEQRFLPPAGNDGLSPTSIAPQNISGYLGHAVVGRWPANLVLDEEAAAMLDAQSGKSSRFFYCAKASPSERNGSNHPTVKPLALMKWLITLVTPPNGIVLDPFCGSGTTIEAARILGFRAIGIDTQAEYLEDTKKRLARCSVSP